MADSLATTPSRPRGAGGVVAEGAGGAGGAESSVVGMVLETSRPELWYETGATQFTYAEPGCASRVPARKMEADATPPRPPHRCPAPRRLLARGGAGRRPPPSRGRV